VSRKLTIAIDGPAGAGKSSTARGVAERLGYIYVDTGAMYRAVAYLAMQAGLSIQQDAEAIGELAGKMQVEFHSVGSQQHIFANGEDLEDKVRRPEVGAMSSAVSAIPPVRKNLLQTQRDLARDAGVVMEGRDIGTVVLPDADLKIFLTASAEERARRRFEQTKDKHPDLTFEQVLANQLERDQRDRSREVAPLKKAEDAVEVVSVGLSLEQVIERIVAVARAKEAEADA